MGRKLDALLGRNRYLKPSKIKILVNMAISRTAILKNQHRARCSLARADVLQLLNLSYQHRAQLRVEIVIKENNMMDALGMIEDYCSLLIEKVALLQMNKECPGEVKEAISSLIFASSRFGEFPELQEIRRIFELKFGKEFASSAVNLRNNCGVSPKMIQKFSTKQPNAETKLKVLKEIASENGITLHLEEEPAIVIKVNQKMETKKSGDLDNPEVMNTTDNPHEVIMSEETASESVRAKKFKDAASAAQEAFQSAAYAALAAKAAIELSRSESQDIHIEEKNSDLESSHEPKINPDELESCSSEYEDQDAAESNQEEIPEEPAKEIMLSDPNLDSDISNLKEQSSSSKPYSISEPESDKLISKEDEVVIKNKISEEDIRVEESK
ncbi:IST1-like protein, partial [Cucurbita argyrosperma subsp. sororia]